jgi:hypothetical protein
VEDRPDLRRLQPLVGEAGARRLTVRVDRLHYGADPLHDAVARVRRILQSPRPGIVSLRDVTIEHVRLNPRVGFDGRAIPEPRGSLTGLDTGGNGGSGFPSSTVR